MSVRLFGTPWTSPIVLSPVSSQQAFHPDGEIASAKAARNKNHLQMLSTVSSVSVEDVTAARGAPVWQQLYATDVWDVTRAIVKRAEAAGCPVLVLTVDLQPNSNRETLWRAKKIDARDPFYVEAHELIAEARTHGITIDGWPVRTPDGKQLSH